LTENPQWDHVEFVEDGVRYRGTNRTRTGSRTTHKSKASKATTKSDGSATKQEGETNGEEEQQVEERAGTYISEKASYRSVIILGVSCTGWALLAMSLLVFHALTFILSSSKDMHTTHAEGAIVGRRFYHMLNTFFDLWTPFVFGLLGIGLHCRFVYHKIVLNYMTYAFFMIITALFANVGYVGLFGVLTAAFSVACALVCVIVRLMGEMGIVLLDLGK